MRDFIFERRDHREIILRLRLYMAIGAIITIAYLWFQPIKSYLSHYLIVTAGIEAIVFGVGVYAVLFFHSLLRRFLDMTLSVKDKVFLDRLIVITPLPKSLYRSLPKYLGYGPVKILLLGELSKTMRDKITLCLGCAMAIIGSVFAVLSMIDYWKLLYHSENFFSRLPIHKRLTMITGLKGFDYMFFALGLTAFVGGLIGAIQSSRRLCREP